ncbi:LOW QUALITY PROTEIN: phosphoglycerate mutase family 2 [Bacillus sp. JCM 19045]|nr:LOW QUALITY PROTEIN: phosphoglycerate mutase family 2 [Bacillus sp. JCM 19045]
MEKQIIYFVRHAEAVGQEPDAVLTDGGRNDAIRLQPYFDQIQIDQIVASPYTRALETIIPTAKAQRLPILKDSRLAERVLSTRLLQDWMSPLKHSFEDLNLKLEGGESSNEATARIRLCTKSFQKKNTILVTHGNLLALLIHSYQHEFGFKEWKTMRNPDVFQFNAEKEVFIRKSALT